MDFEVAQIRAKELAEDYLGEDSQMVVNEDLGGSTEDQKVVNQLAALIEEHDELRLETVEFADENGEGAIELRFYDVKGLKFVEERTDEGDTPEAGETFYITQEQYQSLV